MIGRMKSAGNEARKADQMIKEAEDRIAHAAKLEEYSKAQAKASVHSLELVKINSAIESNNAKIEKFEAEGDMYEVTLLERQNKKLEASKLGAQQHIEAAQQQDYANKAELARAGLEKRGLSHLNNAGKETKAWVEYVQSKVDTPEEFQSAALTPSVAEAFEKARKWDESRGKVKTTKLKTSGKTLKSGVSKPAPSKGDKRKADYQANPDAYFLDLAKDVLGGN